MVETDFFYQRKRKGFNSIFTLRRRVFKVVRIKSLSLKAIVVLTRFNLVEAVH